MREKMKEVQYLYNMGFETLQGCCYIVIDIVTNHSYKKRPPLNV